jgi:hypothetical protein
MLVAMNFKALCFLAPFLRVCMLLVRRGRVRVDLPWVHIIISNIWGLIHRCVKSVRGALNERFVRRVQTNQKSHTIC